MTMLIHDKEIEMDAKEAGREEGRKEGRKEGMEAGTVLTYLGMVRKKKDKGCNANTTAEILELELAYVGKVYALLEKYPDYTDQKLAELIMSEKRK